MRASASDLSRLSGDYVFSCFKSTEKIDVGFMQKPERRPVVQAGLQNVH